MCFRLSGTSKDQLRYINFQALFFCFFIFLFGWIFFYLLFPSHFYSYSSKTVPGLIDLWVWMDFQWKKTLSNLLMLIICYLFSIIEGVQKRLQEEKDPKQLDLIKQQYVLWMEYILTLLFIWFKTFFSVLNIFKIWKRRLK